MDSTTQFNTTSNTKNMVRAKTTSHEEKKMMKTIMELEQQFMANGITALDFTKALDKIRKEHNLKQKKIEPTLFVSNGVCCTIVPHVISKMLTAKLIMNELEYFYNTFSSTDIDYMEEEIDKFFRDCDYLVEVKQDGN